MGSGLQCGATLRGFMDALRRKVEDGKCDQRSMNGFFKILKQLCSIGIDDNFSSGRRILRLRGT